jgi:hypothetical protein
VPTVRQRLEQLGQFLLLLLIVWIVVPAAILLAGLPAVLIGKLIQLALGG